MADDVRTWSTFRCASIKFSTPKRFQWRCSSDEHTIALREMSIISTCSNPISVDDWLSSVCGEQTILDAVGRPSQLSEDIATCHKRKRGSVDENPETTPRPKRQATGLHTPRRTDANHSDNNIPSLTSSRSNDTGSRSSSPSKRQRALEDDLSKPRIRRHNKRASTDWLDKHSEAIPLLKELRDTVEQASAVRPDTTLPTISQDAIVRLLEEIEYCQDCVAPEETWSDLVVLPVLRLAATLSLRASSRDIHNVKTIDIFPNDLLPLNVRHSTVRPRRVDYTLGAIFGEEVETTTARQQVTNLTFNQSVHKMLVSQVLYSHLEIKTERSVDDGRPQLAIWCAAGFAKMEDIWLRRHRTGQVSPMPAFAPIPIWRWKEDCVQLYFATMDSKNETVHIVEGKTYYIDVEAESLLRCIRAISSVMDWGHDHYLPWFKRLMGFQAAG